MTLVTGRAHPATRLRSEAEAAWQRYASTCQTGGTAEQREWACARAVQTEERAAKAEKSTAAKR